MGVAQNILSNWDGWDMGGLELPIWRMKFTSFMLSDILLQRPKRTSRNLMDVIPGISSVLPKLQYISQNVTIIFNKNILALHPRETYIRLLL